MLLKTFGEEHRRSEYATAGEVIRAGNVVYIENGIAYNWFGERGRTKFVALSDATPNQKVVVSREGIFLTNLDAPLLYYNPSSYAENHSNIGVEPYPGVLLIVGKLIAENIYEVVLEGGFLE